MHDRTLSQSSLRKALEALVAGERRNQIYYLLASIAGLVVGAGLIWWVNHLQSGTASAGKALVSGAIPLIASALSVTRIAACESKIAQCRAAAALTGSALVIAVKLLETRILATGADHYVRDAR